MLGLGRRWCSCDGYDRSALLRKALTQNKRESFKTEPLLFRQVLPKQFIQNPFEIDKTIHFASIRRDQHSLIFDYVFRSPYKVRTHLLRPDEDKITIRARPLR
jgi:hypothetical protein